MKRIAFLLLGILFLFYSCNSGIGHDLLLVSAETRGNSSESTYSEVLPKSIESGEESLYEAEPLSFISVVSR